MNFEEFPTDPEDVKDKDNQAGHPKDLAQAENLKGDQNTGWSKGTKYHQFGDMCHHSPILNRTRMVF